MISTPSQTADSSIVHRVVLTSSFVVDPIVRLLDHWLRRLQGYSRFEISVAPPNHIHQVLCSMRSDQDGVGSHITIIVVGSSIFNETDDNALGGCVAADVSSWERFATAVLKYQQQSGSHCVLVPCPVKTRRQRGIRAQKLDHRMARSFGGLIETIDFWSTMRQYKVRHIFRKVNSDIPLLFTSEGYAALGLAILKRILRVVAAPTKLIAVDCDGTLWKGSCDDHSIGELDISGHHKALHKTLLALKDKGILLAICSKNEVRDVRSVLASHPQSMLRPDDFVDLKANWLPKSVNLNALALQLGIANESILFVDDDALECAEVRANCPDISVVHFPNECSRTEEFLTDCWALKVVPSSLNSSVRRDYYQISARRSSEFDTTENLETLLHEIGLHTIVEQAGQDTIPRIAELAQRANQFHSTGKRWSCDDLLRNSESGWLFWIASVDDRFGKYGNVGCIFGHKTNSHFAVECMVLSCRALHRHVEDSLIVAVADYVRAHESGPVVIRVVRTGRNQQFLEFCTRLEQFTNATVADGVVTIDPDRILRISRQFSFGHSLGDYQTGVHKSDRQMPLCQMGTNTENIPISLIMREAQEVKVARDMVQTIRNCEEEPPKNGQSGFVEERIRKVWFRQLRRSTIEDTADFFALGGDSLQALEVIVELSDEFRIEIPLTLLFEPEFTISSLAERIKCLLSQTQPIS